MIRRFHSMFLATTVALAAAAAPLTARAATWHSSAAPAGTIFFTYGYYNIHANVPTWFVITNSGANAGKVLAAYTGYQPLEPHPPGVTFTQVIPYPPGGLWSYNSDDLCGIPAGWSHLTFDGNYYCVTSVALIGSSDLWAAGCGEPVDQRIYRNVGGQWVDTLGWGTQVAGGSIAGSTDLFVLNSSNQIWKYDFTAQTFANGQTVGWSRYIEMSLSTGDLANASCLGQGSNDTNIYKYDPATGSWPLWLTGPGGGVTFWKTAHGTALDTQNRFWSYY